MIGAKIWLNDPPEKLGKIRGGTAPTGPSQSMSNKLLTVETLRVLAFWVAKSP